MTDESEIFAFDSDKAAQRTSRLWAMLGEQLAEAALTRSNPQDAVRWACCAEACFWKATGEADTHDVKDVLAFTSTERGSNG